MVEQFGLGERGVFRRALGLTMVLSLAACSTSLGVADAKDGTTSMLGATEAQACEAAVLAANRDAHQSRGPSTPLEGDHAIVSTSPCRCNAVSTGRWLCAVDYAIDY